MNVLVCLQAQAQAAKTLGAPSEIFEAPRAEEKTCVSPGKPPSTASKRSGGGGDMSRNRVLRPRGGQKPEKHPEIVVSNPTHGPPISQGSELHLWSENCFP